MGLLEHCTEAARKALLQAKEEAQRLGHDHTDGGHIVLGLLGGKDDPAAEVLRGSGATLERGRGLIEGGAGAAQGAGPRGRRRSSSRPGFTPRAKKAIELALREALIVEREGRMGTEHVLLELLREGEEPAMRVLVELGAQPESIRLKLLRMREANRSTDRFR
jgi:ATP-dependent Clp protease ATP-binding subunit ClpC